MIYKKDQVGRLERIWVKRSTGNPMDTRKNVLLVTGQGLKGNLHQGGKRQITLLDQSAWENMILELGVELDPINRRANLLLSGISLSKTGGHILKIGGTRLRIIGETKPCQQMDNVFRGLQQAMKRKWRGGVHGEVVTGGAVQVGDHVCWEV